MEIRLEATIPTTETPMATAMPGRAMDRLGRRMGAALCQWDLDKCDVDEKGDQHRQGIGQAIDQLEDGRRGHILEPQNPHRGQEHGKHVKQYLRQNRAEKQHKQRRQAMALA